MDDQKRNRKITTLKAYITFPLADAQERNPDTNGAIPSEEDVEQAKDWVDFNQK